MTTTDYLGNDLHVGDAVCWNWKNANMPKRMGRITYIGDGWLVTDHGIDFAGKTVRPTEVLKVPDGRAR